MIPSLFYLSPTRSQLLPQRTKEEGETTVCLKDSSQYLLSLSGKPLCLVYTVIGLQRSEDLPAAPWEKRNEKDSEGLFSGLHAPWRPRAEKEICFFGYWNTIYISLAFHGRERVSLSSHWEKDIVGYEAEDSVSSVFIHFPLKRMGFLLFAPLGLLRNFLNGFSMAKWKEN